MVNAVEKNAALVAIDAKKNATQASHVLKNHVKLKFGFIANVVTVMFKQYANQALKSLSSNVIPVAGRNKEMLKLPMLLVVVPISKKIKVQ